MKGCRRGWAEILPRIGFSVLAGTLLAGCSAAAQPSRPGPAGSPDPAGIVWICRPGMSDNPCEVDLTAAAVNADGSITIEPAPTAGNPSIDCFYVAPQASAQKSMNADLLLEPGVIQSVTSQAAPFSPACHVYAPLFPMLTSTALLNMSVVTSDQAQKAYAGVADAFHDYLANYNQGRGFVLIGHSEGAMLLEALLAKEIDGDAALRSKLVSAILVAASVAVPADASVGGDFGNVPLCTSRHQLGCIVAFDAFDKQPPPKSHFGRVDTRFNPFVDRPTSSSLQIGCVNPAGIDGGSGVLQPYFLADALAYHGLTKPANSTPLWVTYPGEYTAHCEANVDDEGGISWLQVDLAAGSAETRPHVSQRSGASFGLHDSEFSLALGNLVDLVRSQSEAYGA
jgi:hypothetical protein